AVAGAENRFAIGGPARAVVLAVAGAKDAHLARRHVAQVQFLHGTRFLPEEEQRRIVGRPADHPVIATRPLGEQLRLLVADLESVNVEAAWVVAGGAEGDAVAVMAPAAEGVNGLRLARQVVARPAVADGVVGAAADAVQAVQLRALVAAAVHAV